MAKQKPPDDSAQTKQRWYGFGPVAYVLDPEVIANIPINVIRDGSDGGDAPPTSTTVLEAFVSLKDKQIEDDSFLGGVTVKTDSGQERFSGSHFAKSLLELLVRLSKDGVNPLEATWFFYDKDTSRDCVTCYTFFLVHGGKIAVESASIFHDPNDFNPAILKEPMQGFEWTWANESDWAQAKTAFWYRKFYTETKAGQLMMLRPDQPTTYFPHVEDKWRTALLEIIDRRLRRANALLMGLLIVALVTMAIWLWR